MQTDGERGRAQHGVQKQTNTSIVYFWNNVQKGAELERRRNAETLNSVWKSFTSLELRQLLNQ